MGAKLQLYYNRVHAINDRVIMKLQCLTLIDWIKLFEGFVGGSTLACIVLCINFFNQWK